MTGKIIHALAFIILALLYLSLCTKVLGQGTTVAVSPSTIPAPLNQEFTIDLNISGVNDNSGLYGWEINMTWDSSLLSAVNLTEGSFLKSGGSTFFSNTTDNIDGWIIIDCTLTGSINGVIGGGTLASLTFLVIGAGQCPLDLSEVTLIDGNEQPISCVTSNGYGYFAVDDDTAVISVQPYKTSLAVNRFPNGSYSAYNSHVNITVVVIDDGAYHESFNTTCYVNSAAIGKQPVSLLSGGQASLVFTWTASSVYGNYTTSAYASLVPNETDTANNVYNGTQIAVTIPGDLNGDFKANLADLVILANAYGSKQIGNTSGHQWNPNADIDSDGKVALSDLVLLATHYGQHYP